jgi:hypothetical protein
MSTQWITDRLPTKEDGTGFYVWVTNADGYVDSCYWGEVAKGMPWQPITKPAPYVKPKRWKVQWDSKIDAWSVYNSRRGYRFNLLLDGLKIDQGEAAQRIEDLFNEVMP